jgi:hypothetical protein
MVPPRRHVSEPTQKRTLYPEIVAASFSGTLLEIAYTRVFSFKVFYYFTYVIIGVGLLGLGAGGIAIALASRRRKMEAAALVPWASFLGGASVYASYRLLAPLPLNTSMLSTSIVETLKLFFACLVLTVPFFAIGFVLAAILSSEPERANRLYGADLVAGAAGAGLAVPLLTWLDPPRTVALAGLVLSLGGVRLALRSRTDAGAGALVVLALLAIVATGRGLPDPTVDRSLAFEDYREAGLIRFSKWNPVFRVSVAELPFDPGRTFLVFHDGAPGSGIRRYNGDPKDFLYLLRDGRSLPFKVLPPHPRVLIVGSAGGHEVVASLLFGAGHVTGLELNPVTLSLLTDHFKDLTGRLAENPKVTFVNGDARWFLAHDTGEYDLIWYVAPDSYAAMNAAMSSAFVLSESYLYTVEAMRAAVKRLSPAGILCAQFGEIDYDSRPHRTARFIATAREAFAEEGLSDFDRRVLVSNGLGFPPQRDSVILLAKTPFSDAQIQSFVKGVDFVATGQLLYAPGRPPDASPVNRIVTLPDDALRQFYASYPYHVDPVRDDSPFFWHFTGFWRALSSEFRLFGGLIDYEHAVGEKVMFALLFVVSVLGAALLFLPFYVVRDIFRDLPRKRLAFGYFAALGLGFMFVEVVLIQSFTLLLAYPTRSLSVTLAALLLTSGVGSLVGARYADHPRAAVRLFVALALIVLVYRLGLGWLVARCAGAALPLRVLLTVALVAPVGVCLGGFMPLGLRTIGGSTPHAREYVAWCWAVNGFFSVTGSILSTLLAMAFGYHLVLLVAVAIYAFGTLCLTRLRPA